MQMSCFYCNKSPSSNPGSKACTPCFTHNKSLGVKTCCKCKKSDQNTRYGLCEICSGVHKTWGDDASAYTQKVM
jgi:hypothetical protein